MRDQKKIKKNYIKIMTIMEVFHALSTPLIWSGVWVVRQVVRAGGSGSWVGWAAGEVPVPRGSPETGAAGGGRREEVSRGGYRQ